MEERDRRHEDRRLASIETELKNLMREVGRIRTTLGDRNTTLIYDLDERYMPRAELVEKFVPRKEHEARSESRATRRINQGILLFSGISSSAALIAVITHAL